jgi:hypothetical protein
MSVADDIRAEVDRAAARFHHWSDAEASRDRGPGKWVRKEILGHLIDSAVNNHQRIVRAQFSDPLVLPGYDQEAWVRANGYRSRAWSELVALWVGLNRHVAQAVDLVPADAWGHGCEIGGDAGVTLEFLVADYLRHMRHHLAQIDQV